MVSVFTLTLILLLCVAVDGNPLDNYVTDMLDSMDRDADPCEDFYQYVCGNWIKKYCSTNYKKDQSWKLQVDLLSTFKTFLESLKTQSDLTEVEKLIRDNYELCMKATLNEDSADFAHDFNTVMNRVNISTRHGESDLLHIIRFGAAMTREIGFTQDYVGIRLRFGEPYAKTIMALNVNFIVLCYNCKEDAANVSNETTDPSFSQQAVVAYLEELLQISNEEVSKLLENYTVIFYEDNRGYSKQMNRNQAEQVMVRKVRENWRQYRQKDQSEKCIDFIEKHSLGAFLRSYAKRELKREVVQLKAELDMFVNLIAGAFPTLISTNRWMPLTETVSLIKHIDDIHFHLSLPDWCLSEDTVLARSLRYIVNVSFVENDRRACQSMKNDPIAKFNCFLSDQFPKDLQYGGGYIPRKHKIEFPVGALLEPSFIAGSELQAVRYGRLGSVLGHELMHSVHRFIVNASSKLGDSFNISNEEVVKCVVDMYKTALLFHNLTDSSVTASEDIPDIEGLKLAYLAYTFQKLVSLQPPKPERLAKFSDDQLFFISFANNLCDCQTQKEYDAHSLHRIRAEIPAWEMPQFGTAFQCKPNSTYNTRKKCKIYSELSFAS